jgi:hypothetical protein
MMMIAGVILESYDRSCEFVAGFVRVIACSCSPPDARQPDCSAGLC